MMPRAAVILAVALAAAAGGLAPAQEQPQGMERSVAPPPSEALPPPPEPITPAATENEMAPDEEAPPPPEMAEEPAPKAATQSRAAAAAQSNVQEAEEAPPPPPPPPLKRPRFTAAILQAVEKPTGDTLRFEAKVGQSIRYKGLTLTVHACETNASDDDVDDAFAHMEVSSQPPVVAGRRPLPTRQVFRGWMFSASQGLHPLEHPNYDLWLIACKTDAPAAPGSSL